MAVVAAVVTTAAAIFPQLLPFSLRDTRCYDCRFLHRVLVSLTPVSGSNMPLVRLRALLPHVIVERSIRGRDHRSPLDDVDVRGKICMV